MGDQLEQQSDATTATEREQYEAVDAAVREADAALRSACLLAGIWYETVRARREKIVGLAFIDGDPALAQDYETATAMERIVAIRDAAQELAHWAPGTCEWAEEI